MVKPDLPVVKPDLLRRLNFFVGKAELSAVGTEQTMVEEESRAVRAGLSGLNAKLSGQIFR